LPESLPVLFLRKEQSVLNQLMLSETKHKNQIRVIRNIFSNDLLNRNRKQKQIKSTNHEKNF